MQYLFAWSMNTPANLVDDLRVFFENMEQPREHYAFGEELIHGVIANVADIDARVPVINGIVVAENEAQAEARCLGRINRGAEFAAAALEMAALGRRRRKARR